MGRKFSKTALRRAYEEYKDRDPQERYYDRTTDENKENYRAWLEARERVNNERVAYVAPTTQAAEPNTLAARVNRPQSTTQSISQNIRRESPEDEYNRLSQISIGDYTPQARTSASILHDLQTYNEGNKDTSTDAKERRDRVSRLDTTSRLSRTPEEEYDYATEQLKDLSEEQRKALNEYNKYDRSVERSYLANDIKKDYIDKYGVSEDEFDLLAQYSGEVRNADLRQERQETVNKWLNSGNPVQDFAVGTGLTLANIISAPAKGLGALAESVRSNYYADKNAPIDTNADVFGTALRDAQEATGNRIENSWAGAPGRVAYDLGESIGESALAMYIGGGVGGAAKAAGLSEKVARGLANLATLPMFGSNAYSSTLEAAQNRGIAKDKAVLTAVASGTWEMLTEMVSLDHFWDVYKSKGTKAARNALVDWAVQAGIEGSEEGANDVLNLISDSLINGDKAEYKQIEESFYQENLQNGMTEEEARAEAKKQARREWGKQTILDMVGGTVSGTLFGGFNYAANSVAARKLFEDGNYREFAESIEDGREAYKSDKAYDLAKRTKEFAMELADKADSGKKVTNNDRVSLNNLMNEMMSEAREDEKAPEKKETQVQTSEQVPAEYRQQATEITEQQALKNFSEAGNASELVKAHKDMQNSSVMTAEEKERSESAYQLQKQRLISEGQTTSEEIDAKENAITPEEAYRAGQNGEEVDLPTPELARAYNAGKIDSLKNTGKEKVSKEEMHSVGATTIYGEPLNIKGLAEENGKLVYETSKGNVPISEVSMDDTPAQKLYSAAISQPSNTYSKAFIEYYPGDMPVTTYTMAFNRFRNAGRLGVASFEDMMKKEDFLTKAIGENAAREIYALGQGEGKTGTKKVTKAKRATGKVTDNRKNKTKNPVFSLAKEYSERTGIDTELSDNMDSRIQGEFNVSMSKVILNANSNKMLQTFFHETMGEFMEAYNSEDMKEIQDSILQWYLDSYGQDWLDSHIEAYRSAYEQAEGEKSFREAADEFINDALFGLFNSPEGLQDYTEWLYKNKTQTETKSILQRLADFIKDLVDSLRAYIDDHADMSNASKAAMQMEADRAAGLRARILDAMDTAIENYKNAQDGETEADTRHSLDDDIVVEEAEQAEEGEYAEEAQNTYTLSPDGMTAISEDGEEVVVVPLEGIRFSGRKGFLKAIPEVRKALLGLRGQDVTIKADGRKVHFDKRFAKEYVLSKSTLNADKTTQNVKLNAANRIKSVVENAKNPRWSEDTDGKHGKLANRGWTYYDITFLADIGNGVYLETKGRLAVRMDDNGNDYAYDLDKIKLEAVQTINSSPSIRPLSNPSITPGTENTTPKSASNSRKSLDVDSEGRKLSEGQQEYFKDSKIRDEKGRLVTVYHGTPYGGFTTFKNDLNYFTPNAEYAERYHSPSASSIRGKYDPATNEMTYKGYLNITKPFDIADPETREIFINDYVKGGWSASIDPNLPNSEIQKRIEDGIDWTEADNIKEYIDENELDYDGIILDEGAGGGYGLEVEDHGISYVTFNSNQFKNVDNENPTEDPDIRYSIAVDDEAIANAFSMSDDGRLALTNPRELSTEQWRDIQRAADRLGYEIGSPAAAKEVYTRLSEASKEAGRDIGMIFNDDLSNALKKLYGITSETEDSKGVSEKEAKEIAKKAEEYFGTTSRYDLAGYLDVNGKFLDFSEGQGYRVQDHREISEVLDMPEDAGYSDALIEFMNQGNIRLQSYGIDISMMPNDVQQRELRGFFNNLDGEVVVDFSTETGHTLGSAEYRKGTSSTRILNDIKAFYEGGDLPTGNSDVRFSLAIPIDPTFITAEEQIRVDKDEQKLKMQLDNWMKGQMPKDGYFDFGDTSDFLVGLGAPRLKVVLNEDNILKFTTEYKHHAVALEDIKRIPSELADPLMVFEGSVKNSFAIITGLIDKAGDPILVALHIDRKQDRINVNRIASIYGKGNIKNYIEEQVKKKNYKDGDKKRSSRWGYELGLQLPSLVQSNTSTSRKIITSGTENATTKSASPSRKSLNVDSEGRKLSEGQRDYFKDSKLVDEEGHLKVMYHGTRYAGFTVFDLAHMDDGRSIFLTDNNSVAKTYSGTHDIYEPDKEWSYRELEDAISYSTGGDWELEKDDNGVKITELGFIDQPDVEHSFKTVKAAQEYFVTNYLNKMDLRSAGEMASNYKVYGNAINPLIIDAKGNQWNELPVGRYDKHYGDVDITYQDGTYEVEYMDGQTYEWHHESFDSKNKLEDKFGKIPEIFGMSEVFFNDIYLDKNNERVPTNTRDYSRYAKENGYDSVIFKNVVDTGIYGTWEEENIESTVAVLFDPSQVKSVNNENPSTDSDIRFSLDVDDDLFWAMEHAGSEGDAIIKEVMPDYETEVPYYAMNKAMDSMKTILTSVNNVMKGQKVSESTINKIAEELKDYAKSDIPTKQLADNLYKIFDWMQNSKDVNYEDAIKFIAESVSQVYDYTVDKDTQEYKNYEDLKKYIQSYKAIKLDDLQKKEVTSYYGSWNNFFGQASSIMHINDKGELLDKGIYNEIVAEASKHGVAMPLDAPSPMQPIYIMEALEAIKPEPIDLYGADRVEAATDLAMRVLESYFRAEAESIRHNARSEALSGTEAGKAAQKVLNENIAKLRQQNEKYRESLRKAFDEKLEEKEKKIKKLQEQNKELYDANSAWYQKAKELTEGQIKKQASYEARNKGVAAYKEAQERIRQRKLINRVGMDMINRLISPTDKKHIPDPLQIPVAEFLSGINFISNRAKLNSDNTLKWRDKMNALAQVMDDIAKGKEDLEGLDLASLIDPEIAVRMRDFTKDHEDKVRVSELDSESLKELAKIMRSLSAIMNKSNEFFSNKHYTSIDQCGDVTIREISEKKDLKDYGEVKQALYNIANVDMLEPISYFTEMGTAPRSIYEELRDARDVKTSRIKQTGDYMKKLLKGIDVSTWTGDKATVHEFHISNVGTNDDPTTIKMTEAQIMSLYKSISRQQAKHHIAIGGLTVEDFDTRSGLKKNVYRTKRPVHITPMEYNQIISVLTDEQKHIADEMQKYMATECAKWGNRVTRELYGYSKFTEQDYFPIKVDSNSIATTDRNDRGNESYNAIRNMSASKELTPKANNALVVRDIFDVFSDHVTDMATYEGYCLPLSDALRWFNYKKKTDNKGVTQFSVEGDENNPDKGITIKTTDSVKEQITRVYGEHMKKYFTNLIKDINGEKSGGYSTTLDKFMGNYKAAAVGANFRVVIQQPTAYVRAAYCMDSKYLIRALLETGKARKYSKEAIAKVPLAWWKSQGYYETSLGKSLKEMITGIETLRDKIDDATGKGAQVADDLTWGMIYRAVQLEVEDTTDLKPGTSEFDQAVVERATDIYDQTQVVDTVMNKPQFIRDSRDFVRMATAFMNEPMKSWNMLHRAFISDKVGKTKKMLGKAVAVYVVTNIFVAAAQSFVDAFRNDDDETPWIERFLDAMFGYSTVMQEDADLKKKAKAVAFANLGDDLNPLNLFPYFKEISSMMQGYDSSRMDTAWMTSIYRAIKATSELITGEGKKTPYGVFKADARAISQMTGLPIYNVMREIETIYNNISDTNLNTSMSSEYGYVYDAIKSGKDIEVETVKLRDKKIDKYLSEGVSQEEAEKKTRQYMSSAITSKYKDQLISLYESDKAAAGEMKQKLIQAYVGCGLTREEANDKINKWIE